MLSQSGEFPSNIRVQRPHCGIFSSIGLSYQREAMADYEGECEAKLPDRETCGVRLLLTVTFPNFPQ